MLRESLQESILWFLSNLQPWDMYVYVRPSLRRAMNKRCLNLIESGSGVTFFHWSFTHVQFYLELFLGIMQAIFATISFAKKEKKKKKKRKEKSLSCLQVQMYMKTWIPLHSALAQPIMHQYKFTKQSSRMAWLCVLLCTIFDLVSLITAFNFIKLPTCI